MRRQNVLVLLSGERQPPGCGLFAIVAPIRGLTPPARNDRLKPGLQRAGYSLIELITVIAIISAVMTTSTLLFVVMLRSEKNTSIAVAEQQTLARLATQFRRDAHRADSAAATTAADGAAELAFATGTQESVRYVITAENLERLAPVAEGIHRETFRIRHAGWSFEPPADGKQIVVLQLQLPGDPGSSPSESISRLERRWRIEAGLGLVEAPPAKEGGS